MENTSETLCTERGSKMGRYNLKGKVALVTGVSRQKGIGAAICKRLAQDGANIFFTYWTNYDQSMPWGAELTEPEEIQKEIQAFGVSCEKIELDLTKPESIPLLFETVELQMGSPSILVNNATYSVNDTYESISAEGLDAHYSVNVRATTLISVEFCKRFKHSSGGRIVNMSSGQSLGSMYNEISYAITKGAVETLTTTLAAAVMENGITVNAINPGATDTGWITDDFREEFKESFPLGRVGLPSDAARLIAFLASEEAEWITGQVIHSEGGFRR